MQCDECKERPATLHLIHDVNGQKVSLQVCEVCANKLNDEFAQKEDNYTFHDLLTGLFHMTQSNMELEKNQYVNEENELQCDQCGLSFHEFQHLGKFGCAQCYHTFKSKLDSVFRRAQSGNTTHYGKVPKAYVNDLSISNQIQLLKHEMKQLIEVEAFEKAAIVRDKIKGLQSESEDE